MRETYRATNFHGMPQLYTMRQMCRATRSRESIQGPCLAEPSGKPIRLRIFMQCHQANPSGSSCFLTAIAMGENDQRLCLSPSVWFPRLGCCGLVFGLLPFPKLTKRHAKLAKHPKLAATKAAAAASKWRRGWKPQPTVAAAAEWWWSSWKSQPAAGAAQGHISHKRR